MQKKTKISQTLTKNASKAILQHAVNSKDYCWVFFGEPQKNEKVTAQTINNCLKRLKG